MGSRNMSWRVWSKMTEVKEATKADPTPKGAEKEFLYRKSELEEGVR